METAIVVVIVTGCFGLVGTTVAAAIAARAPGEQVGLDTLQAAIETQGAQLERQDGRIRTLEMEVRTCHDERDRDRDRYRADLNQIRTTYGAELDELRRKIGDRP